jgi:CelD/BcsL family acetyltransferase involved in cellulose biosynthesis
VIAVPTVSDQSLHVEVVNSFDAMIGLAGEWTALEARTPEATGFQSFAWCHAWLNAALATGKSCTPRIVVVRENGRLVMLWPIQITTFMFVTVARWIGEPMTQYGDILAEEGPERARWRKAAEQTMQQWTDVDLFMFARLRADGVFARTETISGSAAQSQFAPFVDLQMPFEAARRHKSLERRAKRLASFGAVRFAEIVEPAQREKMVRVAIDMKRNWLRSRRFFSVTLSDLTAVHFLADLAHSGYLRIHCLWVDDRVAALDLGFGKTVHRSLLGCYDLAFAGGSPGHSLTSKMIEQLRADGAERLDLLWPSDTYKYNFATGATAIGAQLIPMSLRGRAAAFAVGFLRPSLKESVALFSTLRKRSGRLIGAR